MLHRTPQNILQRCLLKIKKIHNTEIFWPRLTWVFKVFIFILNLLLYSIYCYLLCDSLCRIFLTIHLSPVPVLQPWENRMLCEEHKRNLFSPQVKACVNYHNLTWKLQLLAFNLALKLIHNTLNILKRPRPIWNFEGTVHPYIKKLV